jgi:hypothetical protein
MKLLKNVFLSLAWGLALMLVPLLLEVWSQTNAFTILVSEVQLTLYVDWKDSESQAHTELIFY